MGSYNYSVYYDAIVCVKDGDSYTQISQTRSYSVECYATAVLKQQSAAFDDLKNCVIAMMTYGNLSNAQYG